MTREGPAPSLAERIAFMQMPVWVLLLLMVLGLVLTIRIAELAHKGDSDKYISKIAHALAQIPSTLAQIRHNGLQLHPGPLSPRNDYLRLPGGLWRNPASGFVDPGYVLVTAFDETLGRNELHLLRLSDGKIVHRYVLDLGGIEADSQVMSAMADLKHKAKSRHLAMRPLLLPDGSVVVHGGISPLARIDVCGKVRWVVDGLFHHSLEPGPDGNLWAAYRPVRSPMPEVSEHFNDDAVAEVSPDGRLLRTIRIADILDRNDLGWLWRNRADTNDDFYTNDPFHLNDVQPVLTNGRHWQRGDLLLSLRNQSMLMLYRPSTGKVLWWKIGPWAGQHDVTILDDHRISLFDNHLRFGTPQELGKAVDGNNRLLVYDFDNGAISSPLADAFAHEQISTEMQGRATPLAGGDYMVEETERGRLLRLASDGSVRWRYISADSQMRRFSLGWSRYLDPQRDHDRQAVAAAQGAQCR
ncbi:MAG: arylsulfotransferase family protein [Pseudoxanthomonas sp.]